MPAAGAQTNDDASPYLAVPRAQVSLGYDHTQANAPPAGCKCFGLNGGYASGSFHVTNWLSFEGEVTGQHANDISNLGQNLTLLTYVGGPRFSFQRHRLVPFAQVLVGGAHGYDSYFPTGTTSTTSSSSLALSAGGGLEVSLTKRFAIRAFDVDFTRTQFPNGTDSEQNHLSVSAGLVIKFGERRAAVAPAPQPLDEEIAFSCSSSVSKIDQGDTLEVLGNTLTEPDKLEVTYAWTTTVGTVVGSGRRVLLDTMGVPPGQYHIVGHASVVGHPRMMADCDVPFQIKTASETLKSPTVAPTPPNGGHMDASKDQEFHVNVPDVLFDFDSSAIRPDAQAALGHAAEYLNAHPDLYVLIGGFADDRGSAEYNLGLGERRAEAARKALMAAGVDPERLQIISYGKEVQVCTAANESCRQQNRRAAFSLHP
jgi:outer membrane protein OmpA-like peptidoglycan-associated protein